MILRQSTVVAIAGRGLMIEGPPGSGKSSLALMLIDRGATLVGDDGVSLRREGNTLLLSPAPAIEGLIELHGVGLVRLPTTSAPAALLLRLGEAPIRLPERPDRTLIEGVELPTLAFDGRNPAAAIRAEYALALHGLGVQSASGRTHLAQQDR